MGSSKDFSLLTKLTLEAAGFNDGIEQAKQKTKDFAKGAEMASNSIKNSFSGLTDLMPNLTGALSGVKNAISGGVTAFKTMVPAIKDVWTAIAASGIGLLVIGLGSAFAALTSYLEGTSKGAAKLKEGFAYISGAVTAILGRIKHLGAALVDIFTGQWGKLKEDLAAAFATGLFDEIKNTAIISNDITAQRNKLKKEGNALDKEEAELIYKVSELNKKSRDMNEETREGAAKKIQYVKKEIELEEEHQAKVVKYRQALYNLQVRENKNKGLDNLNSEDKQKEKEAYIDLMAAKTKANDDYTSHQKLLGKLQAQINSEDYESAKKLIDLKKSDHMDGMKTIDTKGIHMDSSGKWLLNPAPISNAANIWSTLVQKQNESIQAMRDAQPEWLKLSNLIFSAENKARLFGQAVDGISNLIVDFAKEGAVSFKAFAQTMLQSIRQIINGLIAQAIAGQLASNSKFGLPGLIMAGVGVGVIEGIVGAMPKFANGGIVPGTSYSGDQVHALVNSGEMILTARQQSNLFDLLNNGGNLGGEVKFRIDGDVLVGVLNNYEKKRRNF